MGQALRQGAQGQEEPQEPHVSLTHRSDRQTCRARPDMELKPRSVETLSPPSPVDHRQIRWITSPSARIAERTGSIASSSGASWMVTGCIGFVPVQTMSAASPFGYLYLDQSLWP